MLELYIGNMKADLTGQESILTQKTRTDFTNPTIVKNSFTKTVSLPGTKANSFIFNFLWKLDRVQTVEDFNPSRRVPFTLTENGIKNWPNQQWLKFQNAVDNKIHSVFSLRSK